MSTVQAAWAKWSAGQNWSSKERINMNQSNHDIWYASNGSSVPYPRDSKVPPPDEVPPVAGSDG